MVTQVVESLNDAILTEVKNNQLIIQLSDVVDRVDLDVDNEALALLICTTNIFNWRLEEITRG